MLKILIFSIILNVCVKNVKTAKSKTEEAYFTDDFTSVPLKVLNHRRGDDVIMKCRDHEGISNMHEHKWKFYKCDTCDDLIISQLSPSEWKLLPGQKKRLQIKAISLADAGRYVCTANDHIIAAYQLQVSDPPNLSQRLSFIGRAPAIIAIEQPDSIRPHANVAIKCRIDSPLVPRIWWLKLCDDAQQGDLNYDSRCYHKLNASYQDMQLEENVYVSKLHLRNFTQRDDGLYVCVTMTELGKDYRNFTLATAPVESGASLNLLFLVPFVFILIPVCIDCVGKRIGVRKKDKQEVVLLEILPPSTSRV